MVVQLHLSPRAARDLQEIALYIARDNPQRTLSFKSREVELANNWY